MEKRVNGADIEECVVKKQFFDGFKCLDFEFFLAATEFGGKFFDVRAEFVFAVFFVVKFGQINFGQVCQLFDDALFHLVGGLVGKSDCENGTVVFLALGAKTITAVVGFVAEQHFDVFISEAVGLTRAGRCFVYGKHVC